MRAPLLLRVGRGGEPTTESFELDAREQLAPSGPAHSTTRAWDGTERRSGHPIALLSREFDLLCTRAVDAAEIAAGLEASGINDSIARERFDCPDVFALAEQLFLRTPRLVNRPGEVLNPWAERPLEHLLRGVAFAAPGLLLITGLPHTNNLADRLWLILSLMLGWPLGQAMAFAGHLSAGRNHKDASRGVLMVGLAVALVLGVLLGTAGLLSPVQNQVALLAGGQVIYLAASAVIMVIGQARVVLTVLAPGLLGAGLYWASGGPGAPSWLQYLAFLAVTCSLLAAVAVATWLLRPLNKIAVRDAARVLTRADLIECGWHGAYGVLGAVLVCLPAFSSTGVRGGSVALMPLIWSMGVAEWAIVGFRRRAVDLLNVSISIDSFLDGIHRTARKSTWIYGGTLLGLTVVALLSGLTLFGISFSSLLLALVSGGLLAMAFYLALVVSSLGRVRLVVRAMTWAAVVGLLSLVAHLDLFLLLVPQLVFLMLLIGPYQRTVADPTAHM